MIAGIMLDSSHIAWLSATLLECALFFFFTRSLNDRYPMSWKMAGLACTLIVYQIIVQTFYQFFIYDFLLCLMGYFAYLCVAKTSSKQQNLYVSCVLLLCLEAGKIIGNDLLMQPFFRQLSLWTPVAVTALNFALVFLVSAIVALSVSRWVFKSGCENLTWPQSLAILLPIVPFAYIRSNDYVYSMANQTLYWDMVSTLLMLLGSTIVVIVVNAANLSSVMKKAELLQMKALLQEQHRQYAMKKSATDAINRHYHDIKHYLSSFEANQDIAQVQAFIDGVNHSISPYEACVETGNQTVDIILANKYSRCIDENIRLVPYVDASRLEFMSSLDLCALFGNALDNAIEATMPLSNEALREISLKVSYDRQLMVMRTSNNFLGKLHNERGRWPATSKIDKEQHGYGMESISDIAAKYGGATSYETEGNVFVLNVIVPLP